MSVLDIQIVLFLQNNGPAAKFKNHMEITPNKIFIKRGLKHIYYYANIINNIILPLRSVQRG